MSATLTTPAAFHAAIAAAPDDDLPRLVYADWLDEHGVREVCGGCDGKGEERFCDAAGDMDDRPCRDCSGSGWVGSNGFAEHAEFIRVQCELAKMCPHCGGLKWKAFLAQYDPKGCDFGDNGYIEPCECADEEESRLWGLSEQPSKEQCDAAIRAMNALRRRERELLVAHRLNGATDPWVGPIKGIRHNAEWLACHDKPEVSVKCRGEVVTFTLRRGFPAVVRAPLRVLYGGEPCGGCIATGWAQAGPTVRGASTMRTPVNRCPACRGTGATPGVLPDLVAKWPMIERVEATDREPEQLSTGWHWDFEMGGIPPRPHDLPAEVWRLLEPKNVNIDLFGADFPTRDAALAALSSALLAWAKRRDPAG